MKTLINLSLAVVVAATLSGCAGAAFNRVALTLNRNITVGQELVDLQEAHEKGVISDTEYAQAKTDILNMVSAFGELKDD
ncbi:MAG: hypothetical protein KAU94_08755 [Verrucomicrobia bacterium]|nr:hypothetical protein [Verrucomicrobiota bacterium]